MHKGIFITGTDTGVGKTFMASGLIGVWKETGCSVGPMKPVETGCRTCKGRLVPEDALQLIRAADINEPLDLINPYRFKDPLAPSVAAEHGGVKIRKEKIISAYNKLHDKYDITVVEGAGGVMVPIYKRYLNLDLIEDLALPVVIISRPGLGTINHTLLTVEAVRNRGIAIPGVIINHAEKQGKDISMKTNPQVIEKLAGMPVLGVVPYMKNPQIKIFRQIAAGILSRL